MTTSLQGKYHVSRHLSIRVHRTASVPAIAWSLLASLLTYRPIDFPQQQSSSVGPYFQGQLGLVVEYSLCNKVVEDVDVNQWTATRQGVYGSRYM